MWEKKKRHKLNLRIGMLVTSVEFGGLEKVVMGLIDHVNPEAFDIVPLIFTANRKRDNTFISHLEKSEKKYFTISVDSQRIKYMNPIMNLKSAHSLFRDEQFDLIHTHGYRADIIGYIGARSLHLPILATCHGFIPNDRKLGLYNNVDRFFLKYFDRVIAVSGGIRASLVAAGVREENISVIPNAVGLSSDEKMFSEFRRMKRAMMGWGDHHFVLGYVGRLSEEKGIGVLIDVVSVLLNSSIPVRLAIIGEGSQRDILEFMSKKKGIDTSVAFLGFQGDVPSWLPAFDAFVLPSLMEGTPMALLEAMLGGLPVVASRVGGVPDVIKSGENGILVRPGNARDITEAIRLLFGDQELRLRIGLEARHTVQAKYSMKEWIRKIEAEYCRVADV